MYVGALLVCMAVRLSVCHADGVQKRVLGPLELELQMIVSHQVDAETPAQVPGESSQCSIGCIPKVRFLKRLVILFLIFGRHFLLLYNSL